MAISRTQNVSATANNVAITSTTSGDLIVVWSYFAGTATIPTLAGGFTNIVATAGTAQAARLAYKISTGGETTSGTWTNATQVVCHVYRGGVVFGTTPTITAGNGTTLTYSARTLLDAGGTSWILGFGGASSATAGMNGNPTGSAPNLTTATNQVKANGCDTNAGTGSNLTAQTLAVTTTGRWQTVTIELRATKANTSALSGTLSFAGSDSYQTSKALSGSLSFAAALARSIKRSFTAAAGFIGDLATNFIAGAGATVEVGAVSWSALEQLADLFKQTNIPQTATLSFSGTISRFIRKILSSALTFVGNLATQLNHAGDHFLTLTASLPFVGAISKQTRRAISGTLSFVGLLALRKALHVALSAAVSFIGDISKRTSRRVAGTLSFIGSLATAKFLSRIFTATLSFVGAFTHRNIFGRLFTGTLNFAGVISKRTSKALSGVLPFIGSITKSIFRTLSGAVSFIGNLITELIIPEITKLLESTLSFSGEITKSTLKTLLANLPFIGSIAKFTSRILEGVIGFIGLLKRFFSGDVIYHVDVLPPSDITASVLTSDPSILVSDILESTPFSVTILENTGGFTVEILETPALSELT